MSHDTVGHRSLANETSEQFYVLYGNTDSIHVSKFVGSTPPIFHCPPSIASSESRI